MGSTVLGAVILCQSFYCILKSPASKFPLYSDVTLMWEISQGASVSDSQIVPSLTPCLNVKRSAIICGTSVMWFGLFFF